MPDAGCRMQNAGSREPETSMESVGILHRATAIFHPASGIRHPASGIPDYLGSRRVDDSLDAGSFRLSSVTIITPVSTTRHRLPFRWSTIVFTLR